MFHLYFHQYFPLDNDECATDNGGCDQICVNKPGSFECQCKEGYTLAEDGKTCNGKLTLQESPLKILFLYDCSHFFCYCFLLG